MTATTTAVPGSRPRTATGDGSLLAAELGRLRRRRLVVTLLVLALAALFAAMAVVFGTHSTDLAGARAEAAQVARDQAAANEDFRRSCLQDRSVPADQKAGACNAGEAPPADAFFQDPRFVAERGLPEIAIGVGVVGALVTALIGATAVGADWSSRTIITLVTWEPRRLRLLGTRLLAVALVCLAAGAVAQLLALGLGALTASLRGTWAAVGPDDAGLVPHAHFWRDLLSLQLRGVVLMVLAGVLAASVTSMARHTGGLLGLLFAWFAVVENAVRVLGAERGWPRWLLTENILAFLLPGGRTMSTSATFDTQAA